MKNCTYVYKGEEKTYEQLIQTFLNNEISGYAGILYLVNPALEQIYEALDALREENKYEINPDKTYLGEGEITFKVVDNKKVYSLQGFVDSPLYVDERGKVLCTPLIREDFEKVMTKKFLDEGMNSTEAKIAALNITTNWDKIAEDSTLLHTILSRRYDSLDKLREDLKGTRLEGMATYLFNSRKKFTNVLFGSDFKGKDSKRILNLNLKTHIEGLDVDLVGHIDNIIIDDSGNVHIINYKVTTTLVEQHKEVKSKHQMALLKQLVANALIEKGISVDPKNITLSVVPIFLEYNDDLSAVTKIIPDENKIQYGIIRGKYVFDEYDNHAKRYINPKVVITGVTSEEKTELDRQLDLIFPSQKITTEGIAITTENWIKRNDNIRIIRVNEKDKNGKLVYYKIIFGPNDEVNIYDYHKPLENKEIKDIVSKRLNKLSMGSSYITAKEVVRRVKAGIDKQGNYSFRQDPSYARCGSYFDKIFKPYFAGRTIRDKWECDWEIYEDEILLSQNIIVFINKHTHLMDVVTVSPYDLDEFAKFRGRYNNILGEFIGDNTALSQGIPKGTFGNLEMFRTMLTINTILNKIKGDVLLGQIQVISPESIGSSTLYTFQNAIKNFTKIINIANKQEESLKVKNNFLGVKFYDAVDVFVDLFTQAEDSLYHKITEWGGKVLNDPLADKLLKLEALKRIMKAMEEEFGFDALNNIDVYDDKFKVLLYKAVSKAVLLYSNLEQKIDYNENDMSSLEAKGQSASNIGSLNARIVTGLFADTANAIAERAFRATRPVYAYLDEFYKKKGYSNTRNSLVGDLISTFNNLYEKVDGKKTMRFKNPWTDSTLSDEERVLLKKALFSIAQVRKRMFEGNKEVDDFTFKNWDDAGIKEFASSHAWYLEVPLMKASKASARITGLTFKEWERRISNAITPRKLGENFQQVVDELYNEEERKKLEEDFLRLNTVNRYAWYESLNSASERQIALTRDENFWETNLENILMHFITAQEEAEQMSDFLCKAKAIILTVNTIGPVGGTRLKNTLNYIKDYISMNVYNRSTLEEASKKVVSVLMPMRHLATTVYIMGNLSSGVRDLTEGVLLNLMRTVIKYQTNISSRSLAKAYKIVLLLGTFSNVRSLNLLNQLNIRYRISNVDLARILEVLSSGRGGIANYDNWLYATLRRPDFVNRMTLFVARLIEDGVWDALDVGEDGSILYNWEKDARFSYYALHRKEVPPPNDEKFKKQKGAYYSAILEYNDEHPDRPLNIQDPEVALPDPYTNAQVTSFKEVSNSIYGSYDKSTRAMWEFLAMGLALGLFTTWMNGMIGNYFRKPGSLTGEFELKLATNEIGELLFLEEGSFNIVVLRTREDGTKYYFNEDTLQEVSSNVLPLMRNVPIVGLGIIYSVIAAITKVVPTGWARMEKEGIKGLIDEINKEIIKNPEELKNWKKLISDFLVSVILASIFELVIDPQYKDHKKRRNKENFVANSLEDIMYRGAASSYDGFKGPLNVVTTYGDNMNPPAYKVTVKMVADIGKTVVGDKTLGLLITQNVPLLRSFRTAYDEYIK